MNKNSNTGSKNNCNPLVLNYIRPKCEEDIVVPFLDNNNVEERQDMKLQL